MPCPYFWPTRRSLLQRLHKSWERQNKSIILGGNPARSHRWRVQGHAQLLAFSRRGRGQFSVLMGGLFRAQMESGSCVVHALEAEKKTNKKKQSSFRRNVQKALGSHSSFAVRPPVSERVWAPTEPKRDYGGEFSASTRLRERYVIYQAPESSILLENEIVVRNS